MTPYEKWEELREAHRMLLRVSDDRKLSEKMDHAEGNAIFFTWYDERKIEDEYGLSAETASKWAKKYRSFLFGFFDENSISTTKNIKESYKFFVNNTNQEEAIDYMFNDETLDEEFKLFVLEQMKLY